MNSKFLLDVNALISLADSEHEHYPIVVKWFDFFGHSDWGTCPLTEAGFVRVSTNQIMGSHLRTVQEATDFLSALAKKPGYRYWPLIDSWASLTAPFAARIFGHQQVTAAYLLGMAIKEGGVLVTFERGLRYMTGPEFSENLLILE